MSEKVSAQHILVGQKFEAEDLVKKIEAGESFDQLAKDFSNCPSGKEGGHLGEFGKGVMVAEFEKATFALEPGQVSAPVQTQFGFHLIKRLS